MFSHLEEGGPLTACDRMPSFIGGNLNSRLVLGFDAGCMACSRIAEGVADASHGKLEVMNLSAPEMVAWRVEAYGRDAPWTPTLVEIRDGSTSVRTGARMGFALASRLGPRGGWQLLRQLGRLKQEGAANTRGPELALSRSSFVKSAAGAVLGVSILSGSGTSAVASPQKNPRNQHWFDQLTGKSKADLTGSQALSAWRESSRSEHMQKLMALKPMQHSARMMTSPQLRGIEASEEVIGTASVKGVRHDLADGGSMIAVSFVLDEIVVANYTVTTRSGGKRQLTRVYQVTGAQTSQLIAEADDGVATDISALGADEPGTLANGCPDCMYRRCDEQNWGCVQSCCYGCAFACGILSTCIACATIGCPWCVSLNCCNRSSCYPIVRCGPY